MNIIIHAAVLAALSTQNTYTLELEAQAIIHECPAPSPDIMCFKVQERTFALPYEYTEEEFTVIFRFTCDYDENCSLKALHPKERISDALTITNGEI